MLSISSVTMATQKTLTFVQVLYTQGQVAHGPNMKTAMTPSELAIIAVAY